MKLAIDYYPLLSLYHSGPKVFLKRLADSIRKQNLAKVYSPFLPFYDIALFSVYNKSYYKKKFILRVDGIYFDKLNTFGDTKILNHQIFDSIDQADGLIFISEFSKKIVEKFYGNLNKPYTVIHNSVPLDIFNQNGDNYRKKYSLKKSDRVLITSAHWRRHKRLEETIELLEKLNNINNIYKLIVLGGNKINKHYANDNIIFAGEVSPNKLAKWYRTADIYVHLAWIEPCGNTQIEAMACGLPVVCCNNGGIGETVINSSGGIVANTDIEYQYDIIDYYNPPKPDYNKLIEVIDKIYINYQKYKNNINYNYLSIDNAAIKYTNFINKFL